jgi:hypothetical protein
VWCRNSRASYTYALLLTCACPVRLLLLCQGCLAGAAGVA